MTISQRLVHFRGSNLYLGLQKIPGRVILIIPLPKI
jgi:hypothetical protein